jgi:xylulokinase
MAHAIGIDVGTTNVKVVLVSADGALVASAGRAVAPRRRGAVAELDAEILWIAVKESIGEAVASAPAAAADVVAIGCCSQYSSIVPVGADSRPVADMVLWQDTRGTDHSMELLRRAGAAETWIEHHGIPPFGSGFSLAHILHLQKDRPDVHAATTAYLEPMDYVNARLTGRIVANQCTMFMSQLCDNRRLGVTEYDAELLGLSGVDPSRLPPLDGPDAPVGSLRPELAAELGLGPDVVVMAGMNDSHADVIATGALARGRAGVAIGTTSVLVDVVDHHGVDLGHSVLSMPSPFDTYLVWAENGIGGRGLEFVLDAIVHATDELGDHGGEDVFAGLEAALARSPAGSNGVLFLPWLMGSLSPKANPSMRGAYLNLSLDTHRVDLVRAATEGIGHNLRWLLPVVEAFTGAGVDEVAFVGGAARSPGWAQILADVLDRPVLPMVDPDRAVARGAALFALERRGDLTRRDVVELAVVAQRCEPQGEHRQLYASVQRQFEAAYDALAPIYAALNGGG